MKTILSIIEFVLLLNIAFQDFKTRRINVLLLIFLAVTFIADGILSLTIYNYARDIVFNLAFLAFQSIFLILYFMFRKIPVRNILNSFLGAGDIVFIVIMTFCFSSMNFILFYITGLILSLALWMLTRTFTVNKIEVPLAGYMASFMAIILAVTYLYPGFDRFNSILQQAI